MGRPPVGKVAMTGAERTRLYRLKHGTVTPVTKPAPDALAQELAAAQQRIRELEAALAAKPASKPVSEELRQLRGELMRSQLEAGRLQQELAEARRAEPKQVAELRRINASLERELARRDSAAKAAKTKAEKPPLPPDEVRERRIKALTTQVQNLKQLLSVHEQHFAETARQKGLMPPQTVRLISKALHSDNGVPSAELLENALKAFNSWKADNKAARSARPA
jgi:hypothetical protein